jgi:pyruvate/2-oxoglutarate dehydrogenase complex dihydrolipoamide acyltransferase (E2) component
MVVSAMKKGMSRQELAAEMKEADASEEEIKETLDAAEAKLGLAQAPSVPAAPAPAQPATEAQPAVEAVPVQTAPQPVPAAAPASGMGMKKILLMVVVIAVAAVAMLFGLGIISLGAGAGPSDGGTGDGSVQLMDCGDNQTCFEAAKANCTPAKASIHPEGWEPGVMDNKEIRGLENGSCVIYQNFAGTGAPVQGEMTCKIPMTALKPYWKWSESEIAYCTGPYAEWLKES